MRKMKSMGPYYSLLQKKGVDVILHSLRYVPKRYNLLRQMLVEHISSRTLDARLKELVEANILVMKTVDSSPLPGHEYALTEVGQFLDALIATLKSVDSTPSADTFSAVLTSTFHKTKKYAWHTIWSQLVSILQTQGYIETLTQHKRNEIVDITPTAVLIRTEKGEKPVEIESIKSVWEILVKDGTLAQNDYDKATYRSAFMLGLLSQLECVKVIDERPIRIALLQ